MPDDVSAPAKNILVVDDEPALTMILAEFLENPGYTIFMANSGSDALGILQENDINLMITDICMPEMDGYELAEMTHELYPHTKIMLLSGYDDVNKLPQMDYVVNYLLKPVGMDELVETVSKVLG